MCSILRSYETTESILNHKHNSSLLISQENNKSFDFSWKENFYTILKKIVFAAKLSIFFLNQINAGRKRTSFTGLNCKSISPGRINQRILTILLTSGLLVGILIVNHNRNHCEKFNFELAIWAYIHDKMTP